MQPLKAFRLNVDPRKADQNLRGAIVLPHGTGKTQRVVVIAKGDKAMKQKAGADYVGDQESQTKSVRLVRLRCYDCYP